jgi:hypothetical protein
MNETFAMNTDLSTLPVGLLIGLGVLLVIQITLDVIALVSLYRRPLSSVTLGNKWVWVAIIVLVNMVGPVLYFVLGRKAETPADSFAPASERDISAEGIANSLYGRRDESDHS